KVLFIKADTQEVTASVDVPGPLSGIAISSTGDKLYVTGGVYDGSVSVVDVKTAGIIDSLNVGHSPIAPVLGSGDKVLYVCKRFNDSVLAIDLATKKIVAEIPVEREPVAAAITSGGKKLLVANFLPAGRVDGDYSAAAVTIIDTESKKQVTHVRFPNGSIDLRDIEVSPDGQYAYVTHVLARYQLPTTQLERGWMNTNAMSIIDVAANKMLTTVLLDDVDLGAANPWGLACSTDGKLICVAHSGTHEISVIDRIALHEKLDKVASGERISNVSRSLEDVPNDLSFLVGLRRRTKLSGNGPRNLTLIGAKAYVTEYFSDSLGVVDNVSAANPRTMSAKLGPEVEITNPRKGEMLFHDASLCFQKWQSCATCHPADARPDALNWDLLNDGMGNPKNTKSLLLAHQTPPAMMLGVRDSAEVGVRAGIKYIQFAVRPEADAAAIDEYLKSLKPMPSPRLVRRPDSGALALNKAAENGKVLFQAAGCVSCHSGPLATDMGSYNVGTGKARQEGDEREPEDTFDTPTLVESWRTAPYLHDGRAATMRDVVTEFNKEDLHGRTSDLTGEQIDELCEYVLSL
ncbi:MAG: cell surface protein, partial [Alphaproteobacteria bacterium]